MLMLTARTPLRVQALFALGVMVFTPRRVQLEPARASTPPHPQFEPSPSISWRILSPLRASCTHPLATAYGFCGRLGRIDKEALRKVQPLQEV